MRSAALLTLLCFGCATARPPSLPDVPLAGASPGRVGLVDPELELWLEGTQPARHEESARALEQSRAALAAALEDRGLDGVEDPDALLFVSVRAVARTAERRSAQVWSAVAIVGVVAAVVTAIVLSHDHPKPQRRPALSAARSPRALPVHALRHLPRASGPPSFFWGLAVGVHAELPAGRGPAAPYPPPLADPLLEDRGWWDGDEVELTLELVDPSSGDVRWRRSVREPVDPRDRAAMTALVDRALEGAGFGRSGAAASPPRPSSEAAPAAPTPPGTPAPPPGEEIPDDAPEPLAP